MVSLASKLLQEKKFPSLVFHFKILPLGSWTKTHKLQPQAKYKARRSFPSCSAEQNMGKQEFCVYFQRSAVDWSPTPLPPPITLSVRACKISASESNQFIRPITPLHPSCSDWQQTLRVVGNGQLDLNACIAM